MVLVFQSENTVNKVKWTMKKVKKLTLNRETLRDLTAQNAGGVKGGMGAGSRTCYCTYTCHPCAPHGKTYNKKCLG
jgi:hypothetical protein